MVLSLKPDCFLFLFILYAVKRLGSFAIVGKGPSEKYLLHCCKVTGEGG